MNNRMLKLAVLASAVTVMGVLVGACTGDDDDDGASGELVLKADGTAADFACNGTFADPATTGTNILARIHVNAQEAAGTPASPTTSVALFTPASLATNFLGVTNASGDYVVGTSEGLRVNTRYSYKVTRPAGASSYVDTYTFDHLSPATSGTASSIGLRVISSTVYGVFIGLLSVPTADVTNTYQIAASSTDCDGDDIQNAFIEVPGPGGTGVAKRCAEADHGYPCVAYFAAGTPNKAATDTDASGQWVVIGAPPATNFVVRVMGVLTEGNPAVQIGQATIRGVANTPCPVTGFTGNCSVAITSTHPLPE